MVEKAEVETVTETADIEVVEEEKGEELQCQAITGSGNQCQNDAKYPEEEPQYCGIHKNKLES